MSLWQKFLHSIGLVEKEFHHIVDTFHTAVADLHNLADRKRNEAAILTSEISEKAKEQTAALNTAFQADTAAAGIKKMLSGV